MESFVKKQILFLITFTLLFLPKLQSMEPITEEELLESMEIGEEQLEPEKELEYRDPEKTIDYSQWKRILGESSKEERSFISKFIPEAINKFGIKLASFIYALENQAGSIAGASFQFLDLPPELQMMVLEELYKPNPNMFEGLDIWQAIDKARGAIRELIKLTANLRLVSPDFRSGEDFFYRKVQESFIPKLLASTFASEYLEQDQRTRNEELSAIVTTRPINIEKEAMAAK